MSFRGPVSSPSRSLLALPVRKTGTPGHSVVDCMRWSEYSPLKFRSLRYSKPPRAASPFLQCSLSCLVARPVSSNAGAARGSDMSCLHWKTALLPRGLPPGLMGFVSLWCRTAQVGSESVPAPPGALSLFWSGDDSSLNTFNADDSSALQKRTQAPGFVCGSGVGSLSPAGVAGRMMTPTGMDAFSMFRSWLTVTN